MDYKGVVTRVMLRCSKKHVQNYCQYLMGRPKPGEFHIKRLTSKWKFKCIVALQVLRRELGKLFLQPGDVRFQLSLMRENKSLECPETTRNTMMDGRLVLIRKWRTGIPGIVARLGLAPLPGRLRVMTPGPSPNGFIPTTDQLIPCRTTKAGSKK